MRCRGGDGVGCVQEGDIRCDLCTTVYDMTSHGVLHERMHDQMHFALLGGGYHNGKSNCYRDMDRAMNTHTHTCVYVYTSWYTS